MEGFIRPEAVVLPESAQVPERNIIRPAPNRFSHELTRDAPFYFGEARGGGPPDDVLPGGTKVVLLVRDASAAYCRVVDARGLYVEVGCESLRALPAEPNNPAE